MPHVAQSVMANIRTTLAAVAGIQGAKDVAPYEDPAAYTRVAWPYAWCWEDGDEELLEDADPLQQWQMPVRIHVAYEYTPSGDSTDLRTTGRSWAQLVTDALNTDPTRGGLNAWTTMKGYQVAPLPDSKPWVGIMQLDCAVRYWRRRLDATDTD